MTASSEVMFTGKTVTGVHGKASGGRRCKCRGCGGMFTASRATAKYCSTGCRSKAYRTRQKPRRRAVPVILTHCRCAHCGASFQARNGRGQVYCTGSCKTLAYRARRSALIEAVAAYTATPVNVAAESVEKHGMKSTVAALRALGMVYDQRSRRWLIPAGALVGVRVGT